MVKVAIVGAGKGGRALLEMFAGDPTVTILGVGDVNPWAPGLEFEPAATEVMGGASTRFVWALLAERKRSEGLDDRLNGSETASARPRPTETRRSGAAAARGPDGAPDQ